MVEKKEIKKLHIYIYMVEKEIKKMLYQQCKIIYIYMVEKRNKQ